MPKLNKYSVIYLIVKITFNKIRRKQFKKNWLRLRVEYLTLLSQIKK